MALLNSFTSGVSAVKTFGKSLEVIGDNIANVNTTGFKGARTTNKDSYNFTMEHSTGGVAGAGGTASPSSMQVGSGVTVASIAQQFTQGVLSTTGGPTDLGIAGKGFFKVADGANAGAFLYTRAGDFQLDSIGNLVTSQGYKVVGIDNTSTPATDIAASTSGTAAIKIPPTDPAASSNPAYNVTTNPTPKLESYAIGNDGVIKAYYAGRTSPLTVGQILLTTFANPNALEKIGGNLLKSPGTAAGENTSTSSTTTQAGEIKQGTLELSNVDLTQQFSDLILAQRAFQAGSRIITVSDSVMEEIVNLKR